MSDKCIFSVPSCWKEEDIVNRVASIVCNNPRPFSRTEPGVGYKWQLDSSNDWWMDRHDDGKRWVVVFRYGTPDVLGPLNTFLKYVFNRTNPSTKWNTERNTTIELIQAAMECLQRSSEDHSAINIVLTNTIEFLLQCGPGAEYE